MIKDFMREFEDVERQKIPRYQHRVRRDTQVVALCKHHTGMYVKRIEEYDRELRQALRLQCSGRAEDAEKALTEAMREDSARRGLIDGLYVDVGGTATTSAQKSLDDSTRELERLEAWLKLWRPLYSMLVRLGFKS